MKLREWATPLTMGAFAVMAVTGILMFFHLESGLNKLAHEWLGWGMVLAVILHALANVSVFKRYFVNRTAVVIMAGCAVLLAASFISPPAGKARPPHVLAAQALLDVPIRLAAQVAGKDADEVVGRLRADGLDAAPDRTLRQISGDGRDRQMRALGVVFGK
jgi:hypothetical protein